MAETWTDVSTGGLRGIRNDPSGGERDAEIVFLTPVPNVDVGSDQPAVRGEGDQSASSSL